MSTSPDHFPYEGEWTLVPELSLYESDDVPRSGLYLIRRDGPLASFRVAWEASDGKRGEVSFSGPVDGRKEPLPQPPGAHVSYLHVDAATLDSSVHVGETRVAYARRKVSDDGQLLAVVQEQRRPDGSTSRNFQVYRRKA